MNKSLKIFGMSLLLSMACSVALAFAPGQRTFQVLGDKLNSDRHPVHLVVTQTIDMRSLYTDEDYAKLEPAKQKHIIRTAYDEDKGINAERSITTDAAGNVLKDQITFAKGGYWYSIDHVNKTYDRIPELPGMSMAFAETLISWFSVRPETGNDATTGLDYDKVTKGDKELYFYFEKDTDNWKAYKTSDLPQFDVVEVSNVVDADTAFALPPSDYKQVADQNMRNYANYLMKSR